MDFAALANHRAKLKEIEKKNKYQDLAGKLKGLPDMREIIILILIGALGTLTKG